MVEWLSLHSTLLFWTGTASAVCFTGSLVVLPLLVVRIPVDYFTRSADRQVPRRHPLRLMLQAFKNLAGVILVAVGLALLFLPGQGILTLVVGILLLDFPGKRRLERWLVLQRPVHRSLNWVRHKARRPLLLLPREPRP